MAEQVVYFVQERIFPASRKAENRYDSIIYIFGGPF